MSTPFYVYIVKVKLSTGHKIRMEVTAHNQTDAAELVARFVMDNYPGADMAIRVPDACRPALRPA